MWKQNLLWDSSCDCLSRYGLFATYLIFLHFNLHTSHLVDIYVVLCGNDLTLPPDHLCPSCELK